LVAASGQPVSYRLRAAVARAADLAVGLVLLVLAAPVIALCALWIRANDGGPTFFGHERVGRHGRPFRCWKLRTMCTDAERRLQLDADLHRRYIENGYKLPTGADPRVIPGGAWLRRFYLDELPQLWNLVKGDMALVGPRPIVPQELDLFGENVPALLGRRPGIFGEWTSRGPRRPPYPERVMVEMEYVNDPSVRRGLRIIGRSLTVIWLGQGEGG
jgi:lipopolysaccharide/colanic/teichoic acid biosynthesis glycosyltransferase